MDAYQVKQVILGNGVTSLEDGCFQGMTNLEEVDFSNVKKDFSIPYRCFKNCKSLRRCIVGSTSSIT